MPLVKAIGLIQTLLTALVGMAAQKLLALMKHELVDDRPILFLQVLIQILIKELRIGGLQSFPRFGRFDNEGAVRSHGCISYFGVCFH